MAEIQAAERPSRTWIAAGLVALVCAGGFFLLSLLIALVSARSSMSSELVEFDATDATKDAAFRALVDAVIPAVAIVLVTFGVGAFGLVRLRKSSRPIDWGVASAVGVLASPIVFALAFLLVFRLSGEMVVLGP